MNSKISTYGRIVIVLLSLISVSAVRGAVAIQPWPNGLQIRGVSDMLALTLNYPTLTSSDKKISYKSTAISIKDDHTVVITYEGGGELTLSLDPSGLIILTGANLPAEVRYIEMRMAIDLSLNSGGTWQFLSTDPDAAKWNSGDPKPFPLTQPEKPHLYQGNSSTFIIRAEDGKGIMLTIPKHAYQELTDSRAWGFQTFGWMSQAEYTADTTSLTYKVEEADAVPGAPATP